MNKEMNIERLINRINGILKRDYHEFIGTYFFGSRAKGLYHADSDYDLLVMFGRSLTWQEKNRIYDLIADLEVSEGIVIDIKIYQKSELVDIWTPFRERVMAEGIFYAAA